VYASTPQLQKQFPPRATPNCETVLAVKPNMLTCIAAQARAGLAASSLWTMGATRVPRISMARNIF
jgi:hypothetical protein